MPALAILRHELGSLWSGWLVRLWLIAAGLLALLSLATSWGQLPTGFLIGALLFPFLVFPWFLIVMLLGISPVTGSRLDALADGILSRPITRYEYLLACWAARVVTVVGVFFLVLAPCVIMAMFADRPKVPPDSVTWFGVFSAVALVGIVLTFLVSLGFCAGTLLRHPLVAAAVLIFGWFLTNLILHNFRLEEFSTISLNQALPTLLRTAWNADDAGANAQVETANTSAVTMVWGFVPVPNQVPPPRNSDGFFESGEGQYQDFSFWKVFLGYCIPTLAAVGLATWVFRRRDL